jgi:magnesium chelatase family protein
VAIVGGGNPPQPGEASLAHHGVLFLDELPEFERRVLESLREPLESGHLAVARAGHRVDFPARFQLVAAMNPCPCGWLGHRVRACRCTPDQIARYQARLSGPLLDRIDLRVEVGALDEAELAAAPSGETSAAVAAHVQAARTRALERQGKPNAALEGAQIERECAVQGAARQVLLTASQRLGWSARAYHRVLKVARTIADLEGADALGTAHVAEAIQARRSLRES